MSQAAPPAALLCTRCPQASLERGSIGLPDVLVFECGRCRGAFLDARSFTAMLDAVAIGDSPELGRFVPLPPKAERSLLPLVSCPVCVTQMDRARFALRSTVVIDICTEHGIWLDAAELVHLVEAFRRREAGLPQDDSEPEDHVEVELFRQLAMAEAAFARSRAVTMGRPGVRPMAHEDRVAAIQESAIEGIRNAIEQRRLVSRAGRKPPQ